MSNSNVTRRGRARYFSVGAFGMLTVVCGVLVGLSDNDKLPPTINEHVSTPVSGTDSQNITGDDHQRPKNKSDAPAAFFGIFSAVFLFLCIVSCLCFLCEKEDDVISSPIRDSSMEKGENRTDGYGTIVHGSDGNDSREYSGRVVKTIYAVGGMLTGLFLMSGLLWFFNWIAQNDDNDYDGTAFETNDGHAFFGLLGIIGCVWFPILLSVEKSVHPIDALRQCWAKLTCFRAQSNGTSISGSREQEPNIGERKKLCSSNDESTRYDR